jgi:uncharacterized membrane protein YdjX (TVP38/TMEM64 family)
MSSIALRLLVVAAAVAALLVAGQLLRSQLGFGLDAGSELGVASIRQFAEGLGPLAPLLFVFVVAARSLLWLPSQVVLIAAGLCFGAGIGAIVGGAGLLISGLFLFMFARYAGRGAVERRLGARGQRLFEFASRRRGAVALAVASGYPLVPLSPLQASAGLTAMPVASFVAAAFAGGTLRAATYAFFGDALVDLEPLQTLALLGFAVAVVTLPLALPGGRRWLRTILANDDPQ